MQSKEHLESGGCGGAVELGENLEGTDPVAAPHRDCMAAF